MGLLLFDLLLLTKDASFFLACSSLLLGQLSLTFGLVIGSTSLELLLNLA